MEVVAPVTQPAGHLQHGVGLSRSAKKIAYEQILQGQPSREQIAANKDSLELSKPVDMSKAWLASFLSQTAVPASSYKGNPLEAMWLPNEKVARVWIEYVNSATVADSTPPPSPFNVRVTSRGSAGNEITWDAEPDFESGIGGFFVMRDNRALVRLPTITPLGVYGRPLFQGLSFHDTPEGPPPEMRYLDVSAKPGEKHTYSVLTVNSAGVVSEPSAAVVVPSPESGKK